MNPDDDVQAQRVTWFDRPERPVGGTVYVVPAPVHDDNTDDLQQLRGWAYGSHDHPPRDCRALTRALFEQADEALRLAQIRLGAALEMARRADCAERERDDAVAALAAATQLAGEIHTQIDQITNRGAGQP